MTQLVRSLHPETLDSLPPDDRHAVRSRADLRRLHRIMGTRAILVRALRPVLPAPRSILELGAGDGTLMLRAARRLAPAWPEVRLFLLDRHKLVSAQTVAAYRTLGWQVEVMTMDVEAWLTQSVREPYSLVLANLFAHHFDDRQLAAMLAAIAVRANACFLCEPRRAWLALAGSHLVGLAGANAVTRHDAVLSVRAGFAGRELSALWPPGRGAWRLSEYPAGLFSHCFLALRRARPEEA
jgi:hypothetical protein